MLDALEAPKSTINMYDFSDYHFDDNVETTWDSTNGDYDSRRLIEQRYEVRRRLGALSPTVCIEKIESVNKLCTTSAISSLFDLAGKSQCEVSYKDPVQYTHYATSDYRLLVSGDNNPSPFIDISKTMWDLDICK